MTYTYHISESLGTTLFYGFLAPFFANLCQLYLTTLLSLGTSKQWEALNMAFMNRKMLRSLLTARHFAHAHTGIFQNLWVYFDDTSSVSGWPNCMPFPSCFCHQFLFSPDRQSCFQIQFQRLVRRKAQLLSRLHPLLLQTSQFTLTPDLLITCLVAARHY